MLQFDQNLLGQTKIRSIIPIVHIALHGDKSKIAEGAILSAARVTLSSRRPGR